MKKGITLIRTLLCKNLLRNQDGFTLIELIIAIGLAALLLPAIIAVFSFSLTSAVQGENFTQAYALAQQEMEAVYYLRGQSDWDWEGSDLNTDTGEFYQPQKVGDLWQLGGKTTTPTDFEGFTKTVEVNEVRRYLGSGEITNDPIAPIDSSTRKITVNILWKENGQDQSVKLESYVTRH
jgi:prepilin-type N-terminal cleavage/methylation domain-containing protein